MRYLKTIPVAKMIWVHRLMLWTSLIGLFASTYLSITYLTGAPIVCGIVSGCDVVRASSWATSFGIPRPILGLVFYGAILVALVIRTYTPRHKPEFWKNVMLLATFFGFIESGFLTLVQTFEIRAYCTWCLLSAVSATILFILSFFEGEEHLPENLILRELKVVFISIAAAIVVGGLALWLLLTDRVGGALPSLLSGNSTPTLNDILPADLPYEGPATSSVTIVEYLDLECPGCKAFFPTMKRIKDEYKDRVKFASRIFILPEIHANSKGAGIAAECARREGKYLEFIDAALLNQENLTRADLVRYAEALRIDKQKFNACLDDPTAADRVVADRKAGEALGVDSTPTIFFNDQVLGGIPTYEQFKELIDDELKK
ncbi:MAG: vitamin K epoxide reductase family protein [Patescibacteria group bacterium]|nr:vitamin K epoxide reductase family protein [Patescibacteria group bacterium]